MFREILKEKDYSDVLEEIPYEPPTFSQEEKVFSFLDDIRKNNRKVMFYGDYDLDGAMCNLIFKDFLRDIGCTNAIPYHYTKHTHRLDQQAVHQAIQERCEYMIIGDTGTSDPDLMRKLNTYDVKAIVLDHHDSDYSYNDFSDNVAIVNTVKENELLGTTRYALSAGALCYCVLNKYLEQKLGRGDNALKIYAFCSLYGDSMDMSNRFNRSIYWDALATPLNQLPRLVTCFMQKGSVFGRRYVDYWYAPRINALFRAEIFSLLNLFLFGDLDDEELTKCVDYISEIHENSREMVSTIADIIQTVQLNNYCVCNLDSIAKLQDVNISSLKNYTGLIANKIADRYKKATLVYCETAEFFKGSVRDPYGRNQLRLFKQICEADGHPPAFGFKVKLLDLNNFLQSVKKLDDYYALQDIELKPIVEEFGNVLPDNQLIDDMALYNDFAGGALPYAYVKKELMGNMPSVYSRWYYMYQWGDYKFRSKYALDYGTLMMAKPIKRKETILML